jgi:Protein of unknown function (DUF3237)
MDSEIRNLAGRHLCSVEFEVDGVFGLGASPLGELRIGYVSGGRFAGERLRGTVLPGGGNWSRGGRLAEDATLGTFDARAVWQTDDGALIYVTYTGRSVIPDAVRAKFAAPDGGASVDPSSYLLRIAMTFETAAPAYRWINGILALGIGTKTAIGVRHDLHEIL